MPLQIYEPQGSNEISQCGKTLSSVLFLVQILENKQIQNGHRSIRKSSNETICSVYKSNVVIILAMYFSNKTPPYSALS